MLVADGLPRVRLVVQVAVNCPLLKDGSGRCTFVRRSGSSIAMLMLPPTPT